MPACLTGEQQARCDSALGTSLCCATNRWTERRVGGHDLLDPTPTVLAPTQPGSSPPPPAQPREDAGRKPRTCPLKSVPPALDPEPGGVRPPLIRYCRVPDRPPAAPPRPLAHVRPPPKQTERRHPGRIRRE